MSKNNVVGLVKETWLIGMTVSTSGVHRKTKKLAPDQSTSLGGLEKVRQQDTFIENKEQYDEADRLEGALRGLVDGYGTSTRVGSLCSAEAKDAFLADVARIMIEVEAHNNRVVPGFTEQPHQITVDPLTLAVGQVFGPDDIAKLLGQVKDDLREALDLLLTGKLTRLTDWLKRGQRISQLVPALNGNVIADAIQAIRTARGVAAKHVKKLDLGPAVERGDSYALEQIAKLPEVIEAKNTVEVAEGWLSPPDLRPAALPADDAATP